jgi:DNA polymerase-3 subunit alpha
VAQVKEITGEIDTRLCGIITKLEVRLSQKDKTPWARVTLEDLTGSLEVLVFQPLYGDLPRPLDVGEIVVISGSLDRRDDQPKLRAVQVLWLPEAHEQLLRELVLHLPLEDWLDPARWAQLRELVMDAPGPVKLRLVCSRANGGGERSRVELAPADHYGVVWTSEFKAHLEAFLGGARYELRATTQIARQKKKSWQQRG